MSIANNQFSAPRLEPAGKILRAAIHLWNQPTQTKTTRQWARVFVTVSRQPGAGGIPFSHKLAQRLNQAGQSDWSTWDRELVDKVSAETGIARELIEMIPNRRHNWLEDLLQGFSVNQSPPDVIEFRAYKRVAMTILALATAGHAIIVGQGGTFITEGMPASIHLRLVAPLEHRIKCTAEFEKLSREQAAARIVEIDQRRTDFYRRYWPNKVIAPELFTMTLNSGELSVDEMVESVLPVIRIREAGGKSLATEERWN
ncbi:MAG: cytidylate kinase-like family protein [Tepidisphaeraceae bacterium]